VGTPFASLRGTVGVAPAAGTAPPCAPVGPMKPAA
jgi:hypothetical protein